DDLSMPPGELVEHRVELVESDRNVLGFVEDRDDHAQKARFGAFVQTARSIQHLGAVHPMRTLAAHVLLRVSPAASALAEPPARGSPRKRLPIIMSASSRQIGSTSDGMHVGSYW